MPPHVHANFRVPPSWLWRKCNRLLRLGRPWGAVTLSRWCEEWYIGRSGARRGLKSRFTNYPDHGHHGDPPPTRKIPMVEPGIETGSSWLVVRSSDHYTTRLVIISYYINIRPEKPPNRPAATNWLNKINGTLVFLKYAFITKLAKRQLLELQRSDLGLEAVYDQQKCLFVMYYWN